MSWYKPKTIKVDLEPFGRSDLYVTFKDPMSLPYGKARDLQKKFAGVKVDDDASPEMVDEILNMLISLMDEWNITDPETDESLDKPKQPEDFERLPTDVLRHIMEGSTQTLREEAVPLENESLPDQQPKELASTAQAGTEK